MPLFESESIVLKSYNLAEADRIVVFFTREFGLVRGVAKGAKRLNSKFGSTLEPYSTVNLEYFHKDEHDLVSIRSVELVRSVFNEASDAKFLGTFSYIGDLLIAFSPPHDADETLYRMVSACILSAAAERNSYLAYRVYFELWLLRLGGFLPDWRSCRECGKSIALEDIAFIHSGFQLACSSCGERRSSGPISIEVRELFRTIQKLPPQDLVVWAAGRDADLNELSVILRRIITQVIGREPTMNAATYSGNSAA